ncbi:hypothetical protein SNE510_76810 [Streptomyces sp. NE5-10]|nr:hypothetical protein SNE510_76810 [Streptomyces sp. NE5-10]
MTRRQLTRAQWKFIELYLPIGRYGPYPERLRKQFEGVIWRFRSSGQCREMPAEFGPWDTVYGRLRVWRDAGVFTRPAGRSDRSGSPRGANRLVAGQRGLHYGPRPPRCRGAPRQQAPHVGSGGAAQEQETAWQKGAARRNGTDRPSAGASGADAGSA